MFDILFQFAIDIQLYNIAQYTYHFTPIFPNSSHMHIRNAAKHTETEIVLEVFFTGIHYHGGWDYFVGFCRSCEIALEIIDHTVDCLFFDLVYNLIEEYSPLFL